MEGASSMRRASSIESREDWKEGVCAGRELKARRGEEEAGGCGDRKGACTTQRRHPLAAPLRTQRRTAEQPRPCMAVVDCTTDTDTLPTLSEMIAPALAAVA